MSIESWKEEFYPVSAGECPPEQAARHSLQKWRGLTPQNLKKHGVHISSAHTIKSDIFGDLLDSMGISWKTCALCASFADGSKDEERRCVKCALSIVRSGVPCDEEIPGEEKVFSGTPWGAWARNSDPTVMIQWLEKAVEYEERSESSEVGAVAVGVTIRDVLVQAATTAKSVGETDADMVWEFAYSTFTADEEESKSFTMYHLEAAYANAELGAKAYHMSIPDYILKIMYPDEE